MENNKILNYLFLNIVLSLVGVLAWAWLIEFFSIQNSYVISITIIFVLLITHLVEKIFQNHIKVTNLLNLPFVKTVILFLFILLLYLAKLHHVLSLYMFFIYGGLLVAAWFFSVFDYLKIKKS